MFKRLFKAAAKIFAAARAVPSAYNIKALRKNLQEKHMRR